MFMQRQSYENPEKSRDRSWKIHFSRPQIEFHWTQKFAKIQNDAKVEINCYRSGITWQISGRLFIVVMVVWWQFSVIWHIIYITFIYRNMNGLCYKYIVFDKTDLYLIRNPTRLTSLICWSMICMDYESRIYILQRKWLQPTNYDLKRSETSFDGSRDSSLEWTVFD